MPGETVPTFNRITGVTVDGDAINLRAIPTVTGVANGGIGTNTSLFVNDLLLLKPSFDIGENNFLTPVSNPDIESIDVTNTTLQIRNNIQIFQLIMENSQHLRLVKIYFPTF